MWQHDTQNRRASERKAEEVYRVEVTVRGSRSPEVAYETYLSQERRTGAQTSKAVPES